MRSRVEKLVDDYLRSSPEACIKDDDLCPCGSGRSYAACCRGHVFKVAWETEGGEKALYDATEFRTRAVDLLFLVEQARTRRFSGLDEGLRYLRAFYRMFDRLLELFRQYISCRRGCTACCYYIVGTSYLESELIRDYMQKRLKRNERERVLATIESQKRHYIRESERPRNRKKDRELLAAYFKKRLPCPFLSWKGDCVVYPVRPFTCRSHCAITDPARCSEGGEIELLDIMNMTEYLGAFLVELSQLQFGVGAWEHIGLWWARPDVTN